MPPRTLGSLPSNLPPAQPQPTHLASQDGEAAQSPGVGIVALTACR